MLIEPPQSLQLLLLLYLCCVLVPCINIQTSRKGFAFHLLQMSTKPSIGLSGLEDAVWQSTHRSSLPGRGICIKQGGGIFVNKTIAKALLCAEQLFALCFSLAEVPHPGGGLAALRLSLWKQLCCSRAVPACSRSSPQWSVPGTLSTALVQTGKHIVAL